MEAKHNVTPEGISKGKELFRRALELDPQFARGYVGLGHVFGLEMLYGLTDDPVATLQEFDQATDAAIAHDPTDGHAYLVRGKLLYLCRGARKSGG